MPPAPRPAGPARWQRCTAGGPMAPDSRPTWQREVQRCRLPRTENTRAPGLLAQVFETAQKGELRERIVWLVPSSTGSTPSFALVSLADLGWLETCAGAPANIPS